MRTRQFGGILALAVFLAACAIGYTLNDGTPSIAWGVSGAVAGILLALLIRRIRGK
ncbi:hypothetical protein ACKI1I_18765 [Streptomyces turgidiscabies]|uniref:Putative lipoprotein n=1 Tax=Streptomyces turgidiscabies (strain Car8) TaxID=698760 RepID=L7EXN1_STRT8|nr:MULTISPECIES: hypothetical protein [Streptomyces]ELP63466.1 putative lipoprotein [Streptomyces turgidiscabies Car8]MDX3497843.1 hypothetical protein [Streptomyces turgidiscabies]GAQ69746.1 hypothetical protein T45_01477 [Streptomyces turgidiscabies]